MNTILWIAFSNNVTIKPIFLEVDLTGATQRMRMFYAFVYCQNYIFARNEHAPRELGRDRMKTYSSTNILIKAAAKANQKLAESSWRQISPISCYYIVRRN